MNAKQFVRISAARLLLLSGLTLPERRARGRLSIVTFHRVLPEADRVAYPYPGLVVTPEELQQFVAYFESHFDCGTLATQHERLRAGETAEKPLLAITFDDASYDNYRYARPLLAKHSLKATFFAPVAAVEQSEILWHDQLGFALLALLRQREAGRKTLMGILDAVGLEVDGRGNTIDRVAQLSKGLPLPERLRLVNSLIQASHAEQIPEFARPMTFDELAELAADGHEIGSHSMTHCMMPECDEPALMYELGESRRILRARLRQRVDSFCYPNGNADARTRDAVAKAGYLRAVTTNWGVNDPATDFFQLYRCDMNAEHVRDHSGSIRSALVAFRMSGFYPGLE